MGVAIAKHTWQGVREVVAGEESHRGEGLGITGDGQSNGYTGGVEWEGVVKSPSRRYVGGGRLPEAQASHDIDAETDNNYHGSGSASIARDGNSDDTSVGDGDGDGEGEGDGDGDGDGDGKVDDWGEGEGTGNHGRDRGGYAGRRP